MKYFLLASKSYRTSQANRLAQVSARSQTLLGRSLWRADSYIDLRGGGGGLERLDTECINGIHISYVSSLLCSVVCHCQSIA